MFLTCNYEACLKWCVLKRQNLHSGDFFSPQETEKRQEEERIRMENILSGNPLLNYTSQVQKGDLKVSHWDIAHSCLANGIPRLTICFVHRWSDGGMMMWSSRTVHGLSQTRRRTNNSSMIHCALSSTANSWRSMLSEHMPSKSYR
jgi:hypothetical protein